MSHKAVFFEPVHFKKRAFMRRFFGSVLWEFTCLKHAPVRSALWYCVVVVSKMLPVKYLAILKTFFE